MQSPIDLHRMSFNYIVLITSSSVNFDEILMKVVQKTSQLAGRLERSVRALISSSKFNPCEESSINTRMKVLTWEVATFGVLHLHFESLQNQYES